MTDTKLPEPLESELWDLVRDALRYRELRKHRNRGYPEKGVPYAMGWNCDDEGNTTDETFYIREGELDTMLDEVLSDQNIFTGDHVDRLLGVLSDSV